MLKGIVPIIATTFAADESIDYASFRRELQYMKKAGCQGATLFGIAGEYYKLTDAECEKLIDVTVDECKRLNLPSVISCTPHSTAAAVARAKRIEAAGADCMMLLPPFFLKPAGKELMDHIRAVTRAVKIPVMLQYAPEQTGVGIPPEQLAALGREMENLNYFKVECKPAGPYISALRRDPAMQEKGVFCGNAGYQMLETFDRGAIGAMPGSSMCDLYLKIYRAYIEGRREEATALHNQLLPILNHIRQNVEMIIHYEKEILFRRGVIDCPCCRKPGFAADAEMDALFESYFKQVLPLLEN